MMAKIEEVYQAAGVVHGDCCELCYQQEAEWTRYHRKLKLAGNLLLLAGVGVTIWLVIYHTDWIVGGLPK